jgi:hypothetical protein
MLRPWVVVRERYWGMLVSSTGPLDAAAADYGGAISTRPSAVPANSYCLDGAGNIDFCALRQLPGCAQFLC